MIYLFIMLAVMVLTAIITTITVVFRYQKNLSMRRLILFGLILSIVLGIFAIFYRTSANSMTNDLVATYDNLTLYQSTIENSTNEYVRYDYYEKVTAYNESYAYHVECSENKWFGALYPIHWDENIGFIDFQLHGDNYYVG